MPAIIRAFQNEVPIWPEKHEGGLIWLQYEAAAVELLVFFIV